MRNFRQIASSVDFSPIVNALYRNADLWDAHTLRTTYPGTAHAAVSDILVWFNDLTDPASVVNDKEVMPFPAWDRLPQLRPFIFDLMRKMDAVRLGRMIVTRLPPGKTITPHVDGGAPATYYDRYQLALQSLPGVIFRAGDETVSMRSGDVWWFDNQQEHEVINNSADDRLAIVLDLKSA